MRCLNLLGLKASLEASYSFPISACVIGVVLCALLLYFAWEGAPWHRNVGTESVYLGICGLDLKPKHDVLAPAVML